jgi:hypothetical protein
MKRMSLAAVLSELGELLPDDGLTLKMNFVR